MEWKLNRKWNGRVVDSLFISEIRAATVLNWRLPRCGVEVGDSNMEIKSQDKLDSSKFKILKKLGANGYGVIFQGEYTKFEHAVPAKFYHLKLSCNTIK
jgi:hypothetical protein